MITSTFLGTNYHVASQIRECFDISEHASNAISGDRIANGVPRGAPSSGFGGYEQHPALISSEAQGNPARGTAAAYAMRADVVGTNSPLRGRVGARPKRGSPNTFGSETIAEVLKVRREVKPGRSNL